MANGTRYGNGQPTWSAQLTETIRALWATWSASDLSRLTGKTRSAIIGKANRLKLSPKPQAGGRPKKNPQRVQRIRPPVFYVPMLPTPVLELDFLGLTLDEIRSDECHYPHGGEGTAITFCGQLVEHGSSYCPFHKRITTHPVLTRRDPYNDFLSYRGVR